MDFYLGPNLSPQLFPAFSFLGSSRLEPVPPPCGTLAIVTVPSSEPWHFLTLPPSAAHHPASAIPFSSRDSRE